MKLIKFPETGDGGKRVGVLPWFRGVGDQVPADESYLLGPLPFLGAEAEKKQEGVERG